MFSKMSKCPYCSAQIRIGAGDTFVVCEYCGREMEVPRFTQEEKRLTQAVEEMRKSTEAAEAALKEATQRAEESDAQMEARIALLAEKQAEDSVQARMHRDEVIAELRSTAVRQREEAKAHLYDLKNEQARLSNQLGELRAEQQAGKAASLQHSYDLGENAQRAGRFDEAIKHFQELLVLSEDREAEVHWRIVLCRYGVEYVREQSSGTFLPTITHMIVDSVQEDADFRAAEKYARSERMRAYYEEEARRIDDILDKYRVIYGQERPYDVFISVKQGDEKGRPTEDSMTAMDLYYMLTGMGLHVFNSRISLQEHAGLEYEPYIKEALMTSKMMLVVGAKSEHMNSPWVRNEWRRFRWLQENGKENRRLIAYIVGMKTGEIPKEMGALQIINAQTSGDPKSQLRRIAEKEFGSGKPAGGEDLVKRLRRAELLLEEGNIEKCEEYIEQALEDDPEAGMAYALKLCIARGVNRIDKLGRLTQPIDGELNFRRAMSFGDDKLKRRLAEVKEQVQENIRAEEERKAAEERARREREAAEKAERERQAAEKARREREEAERRERERQELRERMERELREKAEAEQRQKAEREAAEKAKRERRELELVLNMLDEAGGNGEKPDADPPKQKDAGSKKNTYEDNLRQRRQEQKQEEARKAREEAERQEHEAQIKRDMEAREKAEKERLAREALEKLGVQKSRKKARRRRLLVTAAIVVVLLAAFHKPIINGCIYVFADGDTIAMHAINEIPESDRMKWFMTAANKDSAFAMHLIGEAYRYGQHGAEARLDRASEYYIQAAQKGYQYSSQALAEILPAMKAEAEEEQYGLLAFRVGVIYENGYGVEKNLGEALRWYGNSGNWGYVPGTLAYNELKAKMEEVQAEPDAPADASYDVLADLRSGAYMERVENMAANGEDDALYSYGMQLYSAASTLSPMEMEMAYSAAAYAFNLAKELDVPGSRDMYKMVMYELGMCYLDYEEIRNFDVAFDCFYTAAQDFHAGSIYMLGHMYEGGDLGTEDFETAFRCYAQAARIGYEPAIVACNERGIDYTEILDYWDEFGNQAAQ